MTISVTNLRVLHLILRNSGLDNKSDSIGTDELTGFPDVSLLEEMMRQGNKSGYSVMYLKILRFKDANKLYGRRFGDYVIHEVACCLKELQSKDYTFVKGYGCDFYVIYNTVNEHQIKLLAAIIKNHIEKVFKMQNRQFKVNSALCASKIFTTSITFDTLIRDLDIAMCQSANSNNLVTFATTRLISTSISDLRLQQKLISAIEDQVIEVQYQPQVDLDGNIYGFEALARWKDKELGNIPADKFIAMAEEIDVIRTLGKLIAFKSFSGFSKVQCKFNKDVYISINISVSQLLDDDFTSSLLEMLEQFSLSSTLVTLEITESTYICEVERIVTVLGYLKYKGFKISLDDFGAGHSSVDLLSLLPIDELKVDKSIVTKAVSSNEHLIMLKGIISLGEKYNMSIVAEGIENKIQESLLVDLGCKLFQGYFYGKPTDMDDYFCDGNS